jgi:hypothetical protein
MSDLPLREGKTYGHYHIQRQLGAGGMGVAFASGKVGDEHDVAGGNVAC